MPDDMPPRERARQLVADILHEIGEVGRHRKEEVEVDG